MNAQDDIIEAVLTALRAAPALCDGEISEDLDLEMIPDTVQRAIGLRMQDSEPSDATIQGGPTDWTTHLAIVCFARRDGRTTAGRASRVLHAEVYKRLAADRTLGGRAFHLRLGQMSNTADVAETRTGTLTAQYRIEHRTWGATLDAEPAGL